VAFLACWAFSEPIFHFLARPVYRFLPPGSKLTFLGITEPFMLYMKVALLAGSFLAAPGVLLQVWRFISPGLYPPERRWAAPVVFFGSSFFLAGGAFAYYIAFPFAVQFLLEVGQEFQPIITADTSLQFL